MFGSIWGWSLTQNQKSFWIFKIDRCKITLQKESRKNFISINILGDVLINYSFKDLWYRWQDTHRSIISFIGFIIFFVCRCYVSHFHGIWKATFRKTFVVKCKNKFGIYTKRFAGILSNVAGLFIFKFAILFSILYKLVLENEKVSMLFIFSLIFIILGCLLNLRIVRRSHPDFRQKQFPFWIHLFAIL